MNMGIKPLGLVMGVLLLLAGSVLARAPEPRTLSLLVVPERFNVIQISFDLIDKRPIALVTYRGDARTERPALHAWTGERWLPIPMDEYEGGLFLLEQPARIILVGDDRQLPRSLIEASDWGPVVMSIDTTEPDELLNALGRLLDFSRSEWRWFARRYNMEIEDISPERETISWYDQMTRARQQPPRRHVDDPPALPVVPVMEEREPRPVPVIEPERPTEPVPMPVDMERPDPEHEPKEEPEPEAEPRPAPRIRPQPIYDPVPVVEPTDWTEDEDDTPIK